MLRRGEPVATALELTREGWKSYLEGARRHLAIPELTEPEKREREQLLQRVRKAARILKSRFGVRRVMLLARWLNPFGLRKIRMGTLQSRD